MNRFPFLVLTALALAFTSCSDDEDDNDDNGAAADSQKPTISISEPTDGATISAGSNMHFEATFSDNEGLAEAVVDIHNNFDGHDHDKRSTSSAFSYKETFEISGKEWEMHEDIAIPAGAEAGEYHLSVYAVDKAGNQSDQVIYEFEIAGAGEAVITWESPNLTEELELAEGADLVLKGSISDATGINEVEISVKHEEEHDHEGEEEEDDHEGEHGDEEATVIYSKKDLQGTNSHSVDETVSTTDWEDGEYKLIIKVIDTEGRVTMATGEVHYGEH